MPLFATQPPLYSQKWNQRLKLKPILRFVPRSSFSTAENQRQRWVHAFFHILRSLHIHLSLLQLLIPLETMTAGSPTNVFPSHNPTAVL